jgi:hypothetical protein
MPDDPMTPLPLEVFMRDYYEPSLLERILRRESMPAARDLGTLNRIQPAVSIVDIVPEATGSEITVRVKVTSVTRRYGSADAGGRASGVYDVRLFRDGQLVGYEPRSPVGAERATGDGREARGELEAWRESTRIALDPRTGSAILTFTDIRTPRSAARLRTELSAYAFNEDRVKSATARQSYEPSVEGPTRKGRAYLVTIGVNTYGHPRLDLRYASNDARRIDSLLTSSLSARGQFDEVISVSLVSDRVVRPRRPEGESNNATKAAIRAVFDLLAGRPAASSDFELIPNAGKIRPATPDDLVVITFSGHGYADDRGLFYLLPSDVLGNLDGRAPLASGPEMLRDVLPRSISSDELSAWLRDVDAGRFALIVDACHATAMVEGRSFKPGPMGSRGLGQLAYDKRMLVLAATQAGDVALERQRIRQGVLSYVLTSEGLEEARADFRPVDGKIGLREWLEFAVARVPSLAAELQEPKSRRRANASIIVGARRDRRHTKEVVQKSQSRVVQRPSLFDFSRNREDITVSWVPR